MERTDCLKGCIALYLIFGFGILWHSIPATFNYVLFLTPFVLLLVYSIILYPEVKEKNFRSAAWVLIVFLITFIIEVYGVKTGSIFGSYIYGSSLGSKFLDVPILIGLNWAMVIWGSSEIADSVNIPVYVKIILTAVLAVTVDFMIEPLSAGLDYWKWSGSIIPLQNYAAWFFISIIFSASYFIFKIKARSNLPVHFYYTQIIFFGTLNLLEIFRWEF